MPFSHSELVERGVYLMPFLSALGGRILVAIRTNHRQLVRREILEGENPYDVLDELWSRLDFADPLPAVVPRELTVKAWPGTA